MSNSSQQGVAVVTGASSGIGALYADRLARRGYDLVLVALRSRAPRTARRACLRAETGRAVEIVPADLDADAGIGRVEAILRDDPRVIVLVNNAGVGAAAPLCCSRIPPGWRR